MVPARTLFSLYYFTIFIIDFSGKQSRAHKKSKLLHLVEPVDILMM